MPSLSAIPHVLWLGLSGLEFLLVLALILPAFNRRLGFMAPWAALSVAAEMLLYSGVHLASGSTEKGPLAYWLVVALLCSFIAYGRLVLKPIQKK